MTDQDDVDGAVVAMQAHGQRTVMPVYTKHLQAVGKDAVPALSEALRAEAEALLPRISDRIVHGCASKSRIVIEARKGGSSLRSSCKEFVHLFAVNPEIGKPLIAHPPDKTIDAAAGIDCSLMADLVASGYRQTLTAN